MKCIVLAKMSRRIFAAVIDFILALGIAIALFFTLVLPLTLNVEKYNENTRGMNDIKIASRLYVNKEVKGIPTPELIIDVTTHLLNDIDDEMAIPLFNLMKFNDTNISVIDSLTRFYIDPPTYKGEEIFGVQKVTLEAVKENIFQVGKAVSNIKDLTLNPEFNTYQISLINPEDQRITIEFISQLIKPDNIEYTTSASEMVIECDAYKALDEANRNMMLFAILMIIPCLFGTSLIFYFIIPICSKNGETIGKYLLGLGVLSADGYVLKKYHHIPRFLSLFVIEMVGGILSFGGFFLVTYIMFCFTKKRRSIHDFFGNSVVIDKKASVWFMDPDQEYRYNYKTRIN